jgi:prephenate dehydrogenase
VNAVKVFMKIAIIGVGLIGGSLGMALKRKALRGSYRVAGLGRKISKLKLAKRLGAVDEIFTDWGAGVKDADVIVICTPVNLIAKTIKAVLPYTKPGAVITDVGSVKKRVIKEVLNIKKLSFVGVHPMAGAEKAGVRFAQADLFSKATVIFADETTASSGQLRTVKKMWKDTGASIVSMPAGEHDRVVSFTSHMPHVIAFVMAKRLGELDKKDKRAKKLIAGSFKDLTRVAASGPADWAAICNFNKEELKKSIEWFIKELSGSEKQLGNIKKLTKIFETGKNARRKLIGN